MRSHLAARLLVAALLVYGLAARIWVGAFDPTEGRYWDERYGLENVGAVLDDQRRAPANAFHPTLSYLPQAVLLGLVEHLGVVTESPGLRVHDGSGFTKLGYFLSRALQAVFGTVSIFVLYLFSRRCLGFGASLTAATLLAAVPWHIRQSTIFKPDILLVLLTILALYWMARAVDRGDWREYGGAGVLTGLAASSKYNGILVSIPLAIASWQGAPGALRGRLARLSMAGIATAATFGLLNLPLLADPSSIRRDFGRTLRDYERKSIRQDAELLDVPVHAVRSILDGAFFGPVIGLLAVSGMIYLLFHLARRTGPAERSFGTVAVAVWYPLGYVLFYSLVTTNLSEHNWLPLTPLLAFAAAALGEAGWKRLAQAVPTARFSWLRIPVGFVIAAFVIWPSFTYAYRLAVPSGAQLAQRFIEENVPPEISLRLLSQSGLPQWIVLRAGHRTSGLRLLEQPELVPSEELTRSDAEIYDLSRVGARFVERRVEEVSGAVHGEWRVRPFRVRPPSAAAIAHPWHHVPPVHETTWRPHEGAFELPSLALDDGQVVSLEVAVPLVANSHLYRRASLGDRDVDLFPTGRRKGSRRLVSERFELGSSRLVRVQATGQPLPDEVKLFVWERPLASRETGSDP
jgi:hypothetical protein